MPRAPRRGLSGPVLQARGLSLERDGHTILAGADASFARGAVTAVVGPSGAGKTSLLRCLNRLDEASAGMVLLDGADIRVLPPTELRRRVGMIFQTPLLFPGGVRANLAYGLEAPDDALLAEALESAALPRAFLERSSSALSVGQAQRVCIARALVRGPEVLLMDEPTSALDREAAARVESLIAGLCERGLSVVVVTHDIEQASRISDRALLLVEGKVVAAGSVAEVSLSWSSR